jgi:hypothetical protein
MKDLTFKITEAEANLLIGALAKQPFEAVAGLIQKLQMQAMEQLSPPAPSKDPE